MKIRDDVNIWNLLNDAWNHAATPETVIIIGYYNPDFDSNDNWIEIERCNLWESYDGTEELVESIRDDSDPADEGDEDFLEVFERTQSVQKIDLLYKTGLITWIEVWTPLKDAQKYGDEEMVERYQRKIDSGDPRANDNRAIDHGAQMYRYYQDIWGENPFF